MSRGTPGRRKKREFCIEIRPFRVASTSAVYVKTKQKVNRIRIKRKVLVLKCENILTHPEWLFFPGGFRWNYTDSPR